MDETTVKEKLREFILKDIVRRPNYPLKDDEPLITGGLITSLSLMEVAVFIENEFELYIPDTDFTVENMDTLQLIARRIMEEADDF